MASSNQDNYKEMTLEVLNKWKSETLKNLDTIEMLIAKTQTKDNNQINVHILDTDSCSRSLSKFSNILEMSLSELVCETPIEELIVSYFPNLDFDEANKLTGDNQLMIDEMRKSCSIHSFKQFYSQHILDRSDWDQCYGYRIYSLDSTSVLYSALARSLIVDHQKMGPTLNEIDIINKALVSHLILICHYHLLNHQAISFKEYCLNLRD